MSNQTPNYGYGQQPGPYGVPPTPPRPPKKKHTGLKIAAALGAVAVLTVGGCMAVVANTAREVGESLPNVVPTTTEPAAKPTATPQAKPKAKETVPSFLPKDGTLLVGPDVKPGTYRATVPQLEGMPPELPSCYIARLRGTSGELGDIISNQNRKPGDVVTLTIKATDDAVEIRGCGTWKRIR